MKVDLTSDIKDAKEVLEPKIMQLRGLFQLWNIFKSADIMCAAFYRDFDQLTYEAKLSFTKSIIIDYFKPWSGNRSKALKSIMADKNFDFLKPIITISNVHEELEELRHKMVAHIDEGYESLGVTIRGINTLNVNPLRAQDPGTIDSVFIPFAVRMESLRGLWWLDDKEKLDEIHVHIKACLDETGKQISKTATEFRKLCFDHAHVITSIGKPINIEEFVPVSGPLQNPTYNYQPSAILGANFSIEPPLKTKIGDSNIQALGSIYEPSPTIPYDIEIEGKGYRLILPKPDDKGVVRYNVSYPKYPYPKIKPNKD